jgi:hypothetical protein
LHAELGQLRGELPKTAYESIENRFSPEEIDYLHDKIKNSPRLDIYETINGRQALEKMLKGAVPTDGEIKILSQVLSKDIIDTLMKHRPFSDRVTDTVVDALNVPRSIMSSGDISAPGRQGLGLVGSKAYWTSFDDMFKGLSSEQRYQAIQDEIVARPTYRTMRKAGLFLGGDSHFLNDKEEQFMSNMAEKIPGVGKLVRASDRAYVAFLNKLRADHFDHVLELAKKAGVDFKENPKALKDIAKYINTFTGRGDLHKSLKSMAPALNGIFFSPRLMASRLSMMNPLWYMRLDPFVRKQAMKSMLAFSATQMSLLSLLALVPGVTVALDPRSSDFGKAKAGNTRYDTMAGFQQYIRLFAQLGSGETVTSGGEEKVLGEGYKADTRKDIIYRFFENKESPIASFITQMLEGKDAIGRPLHVLPKSLEERGVILDRFIPMFSQDVLDAVHEYGTAGLLVAAPAAIGVGSSTYASKEPKVKKATQGWIIEE